MRAKSVPVQGIRYSVSFLISEFSGLRFQVPGPTFEVLFIGSQAFIQFLAFRPPGSGFQNFVSS